MEDKNKRELINVHHDVVRKRPQPDLIIYHDLLRSQNLHHDVERTITMMLGTCLRIFHIFASAFQTPKSSDIFPKENKEDDVKLMLQPEENKENVKPFKVGKPMKENNKIELINVHHNVVRMRPHRGVMIYRDLLQSQNLQNGVERKITTMWGACL